MLSQASHMEIQRKSAMSIKTGTLAGSSKASPLFNKKYLLEKQLEMQKTSKPGPVPVTPRKRPFYSRPVCAEVGIDCGHRFPSGHLGKR